MNTTITRAAALVLAALLGGCSITQAIDSDALDRRDPMTCVDRAQCDRYWKRLGTWAEQNTAHKIKIHNETVFQQWMPYESTHGFVFADRDLAADGSGVIRMRFLCMHILGCRPGTLEMGESARAFMRAPD